MRNLRHLPLSPDGKPEGGFPISPRLVPPAEGGAAGTDAEDGLLQVGDLAKASGKTVRAIHHYEEVGLLKPHARSKGGYRLYDGAALDRLRWIGKLHDLGLSLAQIQELVHVWESASSAPGAMGRVRALYRAKLDDTRRQIANLAALERELAASVEYLDTCDGCSPTEIVESCSCCNHRDPSDLAPHLVAGILGKSDTSDANEANERRLRAARGPSTEIDR